MNIETVEKAQELLKEIKELKRHDNYKEKSKHVEIRPNYGDSTPYDRLCIPIRFNDKIFKVINEIIEEMESELIEM